MTETTTVPAVVGNGRVMPLNQAPALLPSDEAFSVQMRLADAFFKSGLMPEGIRSAAAAFLVIQKGVELGIPPAYACSNIHVIKGKPAASAELLLALVKSRVGPDAMIVEEADNTHCMVSYARPGWPVRKVFTFSWQDAVQAGLTTGEGKMYTKYPRAMLRSRAISEAARMEFPDVIGGMYTPEELGADVVIDAAGSIEVAALPQPRGVTNPVPDSDQGQPIAAPQQSYGASCIDPSGPVTKRMMAVANEQGWTEKAIHNAIKTAYGVTSRKDLTNDQAEWLIRKMQGTPGPNKPQPQAALAPGGTEPDFGDPFAHLSEEDLKECFEGATTETAPQAPAEPVESTVIGQVRKIASEYGVAPSDLVNLAGTRYGAEKLAEVSQKDAMDLMKFIRANYERIPAPAGDDPSDVFQDSKTD